MSGDNRIHLISKKFFICPCFGLCRLMVRKVRFQNQLKWSRARAQDTQGDAISKEVYPGLSTNTWQKGSGRVVKEISLLLAELALCVCVSVCVGGFEIIKSLKSLDIVADSQGWSVKGKPAVKSSSTQFEVNYSQSCWVSENYRMCEWRRLLKKKMGSKKLCKKKKEKETRSGRQACSVFHSVKDPSSGSVWPF